jgi:hypothetical protein
MDQDASRLREDLESRWRDRERQWARKLGRIRLNVEPIEEQLARYRRTTFALMIVPAVIALIFFCLFAVFGRADIGLAIVLVVFVPLILFAWLGYKTLQHRAASYLEERARFEEEMKRLAAPAEVTESPSGQD